MLTLTPDQKLAGVLVPAFALRSEDDLGVGDTKGMIQFIDWAAQYGFRVVQILPINETGTDNSPYNAISSMAIEPSSLEINPEAIPELPLAEYNEIISSVDLDRLRQGPVNYPVVKKLKRRLLEAAFRGFQSGEQDKTRAASYDRFVRTHENWLDEYAFFRALIDEHETECWDYWAPEQSNAQSARKWLAGQSDLVQEVFAQRMALHKFVQWLAYLQWRTVKAHAAKLGVALMGDIPFGISYYSADVFSQPEEFNLQWSGGAPPEPYFKDDLFTQLWGQNWGIPLYEWDKMRKGNFAWWRRRVQGVQELFHLFRIDHILGFFRIYAFPWRPSENMDYLHLSHDDARTRSGGELPGFKSRPDDNWDNCEGNRREGEEYLRMIIDASGETKLIGEDLGMVPDYVRPTLKNLGIAGFKIPSWEKWDNGQLVPGEHYERLSVATYATHDHEPIKALFERWEQAIEREKRGEPDSGHAAWEAREGLRLLLDFAGLPQTGSTELTPEVHLGLLRALFKTNSWITVVMITDLFGKSERFNVPGAVSESNWSRRMHITVKELAELKEAQEHMAKVRALLQETQRIPT